MTKLSADTLYKACDPEQFNFTTTDEIDSQSTIIGQERLSSSLEFGIGIKDDGYNIFALGSHKTNKRDHLKQFFEERSSGQSTPPDICYVNNFDDRYKPDLLQLPAGQGWELQGQMEQLTEDLIPTLTSAFETEEYQNRRQSLQEEIQQDQDQSFEELKQKAKENGL
ncbi:MAG TPA: Lon-like protease helical domain-containing protein [Fodinibius sp.]|nr:Lon-like protease helical domain-containing protein [Fodinibius sp.]